MRGTCVGVALCDGVGDVAGGRAGPERHCGVVRDPSGGVLPGVTIEAASPALIEKVRATVSNADGRYQSSISGQAATRSRFPAGILHAWCETASNCPPAFTATVDAELKVGALEESITVSGAAPTVDAASVQRTTVIRETCWMPCPPPEPTLRPAHWRWVSR